MKKQLLLLLSCIAVLLFPSPSSYACACAGEEPNNFAGYAYFFMGILIFGGITILTLMLVIKTFRYWRGRLPR
jgi:hypothetical protein